jgi:hypothetical protein
MTSAAAARLAPGTGDALQSAAPDERASDEVAAFLDTLATVLRETVGRLEGTVGRVSEMVMVRSGPAERELIVTLQDFDRLQQEFAALVDVISHCAATSGSWSGESWANHHGRKAVAAITLEDLKQRFLSHLEGEPTEIGASETSDDVVF